MPKVTVIIPVYNAEKYLRECLDSVVNQTMRDLQIICVNDGSKDRSAEILDEYAQKDSRIVAVHQPNGGVSAARNAGLDGVQSDYIYFVDSDDTIHPQLCEKVYQAAKRDDADLVFLFLDRGSPIKPDVFERIIRKHQSFSAENQSLEDSLQVVYHCGTVTRLWKTAYLQKHNIRFPVGVDFEDYVVAWCGLLHSPKVSVVPEVLYYYRDVSDSLSTPLRGTGKEIASTMQCIKTAMMDANCCTGAWKTLFLHSKLVKMRCYYECVSPQFQEIMLPDIKAAIGEEEREYLRTARGLSKRIKDFYWMLEGSPTAMVCYLMRCALGRLEKQIRLPINALRDKLRKTA